MNSLEIKNIGKQYGKTSVLQRFSLVLQKGEIGCLLGPSGSGKTTLLRTVAGFEDIPEGEIIIGGIVVSQAGYVLDPAKRRVGIIFQDLALFPHLNVEKNIGFGLHGLSHKEAKSRIQQWMEITGLSGLQKRFPYELSGGEQQRVAVARAMAPQPELLLMDEPFSSLDAELRERLNLDIRKILKKSDTTALIVTHDQNEAFAFADKVGLLNRGEVVQWGSAYDLYHTPANQFVADFIGKGSFIQGKVLERDTVQTALGLLQARHALNQPAGSIVNVFLRPDDVIHDDDSPIKLRVVNKAFLGAYILYTLQVPGDQQILSYVPSHHNHNLGSLIGVRFEVDHLICFK